MDELCFSHLGGCYLGGIQCRGIRCRVYSELSWGLGLGGSPCFKGMSGGRGFKEAGQEVLCLSLPPEHGRKQRSVPSLAQLPGHCPVAFQHHAYLTLFQAPIIPRPLSPLGHPWGS